MKSKRKAAALHDSIAAPARPHGFHVRDRVLSNQAGAKKAWRNKGENPLLLAYERGQLAAGDARTHSAEDRLQAGEIYRGWWEIANRTGRDSTQRDGVSGGGSSIGFGGISDAKADVLRKRLLVDAQLKRQDRIIVQRVCGEGFAASVAVREACGEAYKFATLARLCEALDCLIDAISAARKINRQEKV
jgi:hypothetical protein